MPVSKRNRRGIAFFLTLGVVLSIAPRVLISLTGSDGFEVNVREFKLAEAKLEQQQWETRNYSEKKKRASKYRAPEQRFDPNQYTAKDWMKLGLSKKQSDVIVNFSKRGLRSNDDLKKIFVLPGELYELIKDSTTYPLPTFSEEKKSSKNDDTETYTCDLNNATPEELQKIRGIGSYFSKKIVEYRSSLGGYVQKAQLLEIWKITPEMYEKITPGLFLKDVKVDQISVNTASVKDLKRHPYISYKVANSIVKMRDQHGEYSDLKEIQQSVLIDEVLFQKIQPYLKL